MASFETLHPPATTAPGSPLPPEIWTMILPNSTRQDLKNIRLVNSSFKEIVTPALFRHAHFSVTKANIANLESLLQADDLRRHVGTLFIDDTTFDSRMTKSRYARDAAAYFKNVLGLRQAGPLSAKKLMQVLHADDTLLPLQDYLPALLQKHFFLGWCLYQEVAAFQLRFFEAGYKAFLKRVLARLPGLRNIQLYQRWGDPAPEFLHNILHAALSLDAKRQIQSSASLEEEMPTTTRRSPFYGPGLTARSMHPLHLLPSMNFTLTSVHLIRVLYHSCKRLDSLWLPSVHHARDGESSTRVTSKEYILPLEFFNVFRVISASEIVQLKDLFSSLRQLRLWLGAHSLNCEYPVSRGSCVGVWLPSVLRSMGSIQNLSIAFIRNGDITYELFKLLLERKFLTSRFSCHIDEEAALGHDTHALIWRPLKDLQHTGGYGPEIGLDDYFRSHLNILRPIHPNPWPNLTTMHICKRGSHEI